MKLFLFCNKLIVCVTDAYTDAYWVTCQGGLVQAKSLQPINIKTITVDGICTTDDDLQYPMHDTTLTYLIDNDYVRFNQDKNIYEH